MSACELCGKTVPLLNALVEGTQMQVCKNCAGFGQVLKTPISRAPVKKQTIEIVETVVEDSAKLIREAREKNGMTQKDFALKLTEKESLIQKIENGSLKPSLELARKLEKILKIKLVEIEKEEQESYEKNKSGPLTIGDLIKIKK
ncbi:TIGR00270 family protein [Candidatus Woesearchaeota archaeon]|nr:TIGR00270 family protein [Candidatus Woesearchaeota archaeon]